MPDTGQETKVKMEFLDFPQEILNNIATHLDRKTMKALRLVSRAVSAAATTALFSELVVKPVNGMIRRTSNILSNNHLATRVRSVALCLNSLHCYGGPCRCDCDCWIESASAECLETFVSLGLLNILDRVHTLIIEWPSHEGDYPVYGQCVAGTQFLVHELCTILNIRQVKKGLKPITTLKIKFLIMGYADEPTLSRDQIQDIHKAVRTLEALDISGYMELSGESIILEPYYALENIWLFGTLPYLRSLTLHLDEEWGAIPFFDTSQLQLPVLEDLSLRHYTFLYESQIAWIASFRGLKTLDLQCCPIAWIIRAVPEYMDDRQARYAELIYLGSYDESLENEDEAVEIAAYKSPLRWSNVCPKLEQRLASLKSVTISGINAASCLVSPDFKMAVDHCPGAPRPNFIGSKHRKFKNPTSGFVRALYTVFSEIDMGPHVDTPCFHNAWRHGDIMAKGLLWVDNTITNCVHKESRKDICGNKKNGTFGLKTVYTEDFAAIAQMFDTIRARNASK